MKIIVSLTSTHERSNLLFYTIQSILRQSLQPTMTLVNLSASQYLYDSGFRSLPEWLTNPDLQINLVDNIGSYRKLLPALQFADDDDIIVTADDDILYGVDWLKDLVEASHLEPDSIVCCRARIMKRNILGNWQNYSNWDLVYGKIKGLHILPTGGAGVVYRKKLLDLEFLTDHTFLEIASTNDDLWFKMASLRKNVPTAVFPEINRQNVYLSHKLGLEEINLHKVQSRVFFSRFRSQWLKAANYLGVKQTRNDFAWNAICQYNVVRLSNKK